MIRKQEMKQNDREGEGENNEKMEIKRKSNKDKMKEISKVINRKK